MNAWTAADTARARELREATRTRELTPAERTELHELRVSEARAAVSLRRSLARGRGI